MSRRKGRQVRTGGPRHAAGAALLDEPPAGHPDEPPATPALDATTPDFPGATMTTTAQPAPTDAALNDMYDAQLRATERARAAKAEADQLEGHARRREQLAQDLRSQAEGLLQKADEELRARDADVRQAKKARSVADDARATAEFHAARLDEELRRSKLIHPAERQAALASAPPNPLNGQPVHSPPSDGASAGRPERAPAAEQSSALVGFPPLNGPDQ
jgi:hypothetical protein